MSLYFVCLLLCYVLNVVWRVLCCGLLYVVLWGAWRSVLWFGYHVYCCLLYRPLIIWDQINCFYQPCPEMWALVGFVCFSSRQRSLLEAVIKVPINHHHSTLIIIIIVIIIIIQRVIKLPINHHHSTLLWMMHWIFEIITESHLAKGSLALTHWIKGLWHPSPP